MVTATATLQTACRSPVMVARVTHRTVGVPLGRRSRQLALLTSKLALAEPADEHIMERNGLYSREALCLRCLIYVIITAWLSARISARYRSIQPSRPPPRRGNPTGDHAAPTGASRTAGRIWPKWEDSGVRCDTASLVRALCLCGSRKSRWRIVAKDDLHLLNDTRRRTITTP